VDEAHHWEDAQRRREKWHKFQTMEESTPQLKPGLPYFVMSGGVIIWCIA